MRTLIVAFAVALSAARGVNAQDPSTAKKASTSKSKTATHKSATSKSSAAKKPTTARATTSTSSSTARRRASSKSSTAKRTPAKTAPRQQQPTSDRYQEIQQALADRGYFRGQADGHWGPESVDALKRFQHEQNLTEDGKIGSLSLIALGLGPKRGANSEPAPEKQVQR